MGQTKEGAAKAKETVRLKYGTLPDGRSKLHTEIGSLGGKNSGTGGFWHLKYVKNDTEKVREFGRIGGKKSVRKPK